MTDLEPAQRSALMQTVCKVEAVVRRELQPHKINLASLGNVVPHLHWHVIARFDWDGRWPAPVWAPLRESVPDAEARLAVPLSALDRLVAEAVRELDLAA